MKIEVANNIKIWVYGYDIFQKILELLTKNWPGER